MGLVQIWLWRSCMVVLIGWVVWLNEPAWAESEMWLSGLPDTRPVLTTWDTLQVPHELQTEDSSAPSSKMMQWESLHPTTTPPRLQLASALTLAPTAENDQDGDTPIRAMDAEVDSMDVEQRGWLAQLINKSEIDVAVFNSIRIEELRWSIAGNSAGTNPNIRSELIWSDVHSQQLSLNGRAMLLRYAYLRSDLNYAWVQNGKVHDSDYNRNHRQGVYSRSLSQASGDQLWDLSLAAGYPFLLIKNRMVVAPLLGYSYHVQNLRITNGTQIITWPEGPELGKLQGLDSTYRTRWMGPWLGCDVRYRFDGSQAIDPPMELGLALELHWADYDAEANWNLRSDLDHPTSFEHEARAMGCTIACEWLIQLATQWDLSVRFAYQRWETSHGINRVHFNSGSTATQRLNEVKWTARSFMLGATYHF